MADTSFSQTHDYPFIEPATFDLVVYGTGLPESLLAASAASAGKSVLHLDPNPFYGSHFASLTPDFILSFLAETLSPETIESPPSSAVNLRRRRIYSEIEVSGSPPEPSRSFTLDLAGPRVFYCADPTVDLMLRSGASNHAEFKSVDGSLLYWDGRLCAVPDSRQAIFKDRSLGLSEKSQMTRFLKLVRSHIGAVGGEAETNISAEDLEIPFAEFLQKQRLPPKIKTMILYGIALADYDQESADASRNVIKTREGIESLALFSSSVGRFPNAVGAFIYPIYGHGELPQAFCRCAAVKGALYVLRMPVLSLLIDKESGHQYKGVRLASGQDIFSHKLVLGPSFVFTSSISPQKSFIDGLDASKLTKRIARGVCITNKSVQSDLSNILVVFPPRSLYPEQSAAVRVLQSSSNVAVCPPGLYVVYLSTPCEDAGLGKELIHAAISALFMPRDSDSSEGSMSTDNGDVSGEAKPAILWSCIYVQELTQASLGIISSCPAPDGNLDYGNLLETTTKLFTDMYPGEEFFPKAPVSDNAEDDDDD